MTDTRKYIDEQFDKFFKFDTPDQSTVASVSCKLFAEHLMTDLLAVIAKKDEALQIAIEYQEEACQYFHDAMAGYKEHEHQRYRDDLKETKEALAITPESFELVEVGEYEADVHVCEFYPNKSAFNLYNYKNGKLYTIKQKD